MKRSRLLSAVLLLSPLVVARPAAAQNNDSSGNGNGNVPPAAKGAPGADTGEAGGQEAAEATANDALLVAFENPVSDLISVPFQSNTDYNIGLFDRARETFNIQPVIPISLTRELNVVARIIVPIIYQPDVDNVGGGSSGVGDTTATFFLAPSKPGKFIWGLGPAFLFPTATQVNVGQGKWGIGPSAVALVQPHPWTFGVLVNNIWSYAGPIQRAQVNQMTLQYFINYNLPEAWYLVSSPIIGIDWTPPGGADALVPFGGGIGKIFRVAHLPVNAQLQAFWNAIRPNDPPAPTWTLRLQIALLFPTGSAKQREQGSVASALWR
jgi:hypothetical protein